eukprot:gene8730-6136_t
MSAPNVLLRNVVRISGSSIFFTPPDGEALDYTTVTATPAPHRGALQNNGLIAKICIGVRINPSDTRQRKEAEELIYGPEGRLKLWRSLLASHKLIATDSDVVVPTFLARESWPLLSEDEYERRVQYYKAREGSNEVNQSPFCAPILRIYEGTHKEHGIFARMCVVWMPRYATDLISWSECHINSGRWVPEQKLTTVVRHVTSSLMTITALPPWRKMEAGNDEDVLNKDEVMRLITNLEMEDVLVNEDDTELTFLLTASPFQNQEKLAIVSRDTSYQKLQFYPYMAPEQVEKNEILVIASPRYAVWALGMMVFSIASAVPSLSSQLKRYRKKKGELPLNHPDMTPDVLVKRIQRELEPGGYTPALTSLIALLLSTDYTTRPQLSTIDQMMPDLNRVMPVLRFPFAIGSFDLLHLPETDKLHLNARARKYISHDICCVCKKARNLFTCKHKEHTPAVTSPCWSSDEPLPGVMSNENVHVTYLYPLAPKMEERDVRRKLNHAIPSPTAEHTAATSTNVSVNLSVLAPDASTTAMNMNTLFQLFGGFAIFDRTTEPKPNAEPGKTVEKVVLKDVLLLYPRSGIRKTESPWTPKQLHFTAALPWQSFCTSALQKKGRIMSPVPPIFGGTSSNVKWFAWILPGERFVLPNGREWMPSEDGGFVFWFNDMLEPSDQDRYFTLTSLRALTLQCRVPRTTMPEKVFRIETGEDSTLQSMVDGTRGSVRRSISRPTESHSMSPSLATKEESHDRSASRQRPATHGNRRPQLRVNAFNEGREGIKPSEKPHRTAEALMRPETQPGYSGGRPLERHVSPDSKIHLQTSPAPADRSPRPKVLQEVSTNQLHGTPRTKEAHEIASAADSEVADLKISISSVSAISNCAPVNSNHMNRIKGLQLFGAWYETGVVEVTFEALTFWVPASGEHGHCQAPVSVAESTRNALHLPLNAAYMMFLSNDVPLLTRNHSKSRGQFAQRLLLPNHGLAFFTINSVPLGVLALRCSLDRSGPAKDEINIPIRPLPSITGTRQQFQANYFDISGPLTKTSGGPSIRLRHSAPPSAVPYIKTSEKEDHLLTEDPSCASSRMIEESAGFTLGWDDQAPVSWMGFDAEQSTLVFADAAHDICTAISLKVAFPSSFFLFFPFGMARCWFPHLIVTAIYLPFLNRATRILFWLYFHVAAKKKKCTKKCLKSTYAGGKPNPLESSARHEERTSGRARWEDSDPQAVEKLLNNREIQRRHRAGSLYILPPLLNFILQRRTLDMTMLRYTPIYTLKNQMYRHHPAYSRFLLMFLLLSDSPPLLFCIEAERHDRLRFCCIFRSLSSLATFAAPEQCAVTGYLPWEVEKLNQQPVAHASWPNFDAFCCIYIYIYMSGYISSRRRCRRTFKESLVTRFSALENAYVLIYIFLFLPCYFLFFQLIYGAYNGLYLLTLSIFAVGVSHLAMQRPCCWVLGLSSLGRAARRRTSLDVPRRFASQTSPPDAVLQSKRVEVLSQQHGQSSCLVLNAETYPAKWRMALLRSGLEELISGDLAMRSPDTTGFRDDSFSCIPRSSSSSSSGGITVITREAFDRLCRQCHITDTEQALDRLEGASVVVCLKNKELVHLRPAQYVEALELHATFTARDSSAPLSLPVPLLERAAVARIHALAERLDIMEQQLLPARQLAANWGRRRYALGSLLIALEMAAVARLTFFELDWDTMEPITYCIGLFTTIVLYALYLWCGKEFSVDELYQRVVPRRVRRYAPKDFDWDTYEELCRQLEEAESVLQRIRDWAACH